MIDELSEPEKKTGMVEQLGREVEDVGGLCLKS